MAKKNQENRLVITAKIRAAIEAHFRSLDTSSMLTLADIEPAVKRLLKGVVLPVGSVTFQLSQMAKNEQLVVFKEGRKNYYSLPPVRKAASKKLAQQMGSVLSGPLQESLKAAEEASAELRAGPKRDFKDFVDLIWAPTPGQPRPTAAVAQKLPAPPPTTADGEEPTPERMQYLLSHLGTRQMLSGKELMKVVDAIVPKPFNPKDATGVVWPFYAPNLAANAKGDEGGGIDATPARTLDLDLSDLNGSMTIKVGGEAVRITVKK